MSTDDLGGDPPCWAHLFADGDASVVDLDTIDATGVSGAVWSLPHGGDLDANLVRLGPGSVIEEHVNTEVDVLVAVLDGHGLLTVDGVGHTLRTHVVALVPKKARRRIRADDDGISYLTVHRRREPLGISTRPAASR